MPSVRPLVPATRRGSAWPLCAAVILAGLPLAGHPLEQTDFNWRGRLASGQTLEIRGVNGAIHATSSASDEAEVHAITTANRSDPSGVRIDVVSHVGGVTLCAVYPDVAGREPNRCDVGPNGHMNTDNNDTQVRFDVRVPDGVIFVGRTVNGDVLAERLNGDAEGRTVNGSVQVSTTGTALASAVNGSLDVTSGRADWRDGAKFATINGGITLRVPAALNAHVRASVMNGTIETNLPITVTKLLTRRKLEGTIGAGGQDLELSTVNGNIQLTMQ